MSYTYPLTQYVLILHYYISVPWSTVGSIQCRIFTLCSGTSAKETFINVSCIFAIYLFFLLIFWCMIFISVHTKTSVLTDLYRGYNKTVNAVFGCLIIVDLTTWPMIWKTSMQSLNLRCQTLCCNTWILCC